MYSKSTHDKIVEQEQMIFGGRVERMGGRMCFSDGSPADSPPDNYNDNIKTFKEVGLLFKILFPSTEWKDFRAIDVYNQMLEMRK